MHGFKKALLLKNIWDVFWGSLIWMQNKDFSQTMRV